MLERLNQETVQRFLEIHPHRRPAEVRQYHSWSDVQNMPDLKRDTLVFVDGGIRTTPLDVGFSSLVNDGGIVEAEIFCGVFYTGGLVMAQIHERDSENLKTAVIKTEPTILDRDRRDAPSSDRTIPPDKSGGFSVEAAIAGTVLTGDPLIGLGAGIVLGDDD